MMIRIFKAESQLEVWVEKNGVYVMFATYPICSWSGTLGPKLREGDRQTPEGFYTITLRQLHQSGRRPRSLNLGYPNIFDRTNNRSGSLILIHGGCDSVGCLAMTDAINAELYDLVSAALMRGARYVPVHVFPFRMTQENMTVYPAGFWQEFWDDLKKGYDSFERTHLPPRITVCGRRYRVTDASPADREAHSVDLCPEDFATTPDHIRHARADRASPTAPPCNLQLASCRKWVALRDRRAGNHVVARQGGDRKRSRVR